MSSKELKIIMKQEREIIELRAKISRLVSENAAILLENKELKRKRTQSKIRRSGTRRQTS